MTRQTISIRGLLSGILAALLISCGDGITSSGGSADTSTGDVAGVYTGEEQLTLARTSDGVILDTNANKIEIRINGDGTVLFSSSNGTSGEAQLNKAHAFRMQADARTHFSGRCSGGIILLEGRIHMNGDINGTYGSRDLVCGGEILDLAGELSAGRN